MERENQTIVTFFILEGISDIPELQAPIFFFILLIYLITLGGNMFIILLVCLDSQLHTPMYFFLGNLSLMDMSSTSVTLLKFLSSFVSGDKTISSFACITQVFLYLSFTGIEIFILTAMSYDRYVAICNPLHYPMIMKPKVCGLLAIASWVSGFLELIPQILLLSRLSCYKSNIVEHFYCDLVPLLKISCSDTTSLEIMILTEAVFFCLTPFILIFTSYIFIINTIMKIRSSSGKRKTFYTCSSHLTVVVLFYVTLLCLYLTPTSASSIQPKKLFSLIITVGLPLINPLIYSLKNKEVKNTLKRQLQILK